MERTIPAIERGKAAGGRGDGELEVICEAIVATGHRDHELEAARDGVRSLLAFYGSTPSYRPVLEVEGWQDLQPELNALSKRGQWAEMGRLIDDEMVETLAVVGTPQECADQIVERFCPAARRVCCYFPGYPVGDVAIAELTAAVKDRSSRS